MAPKRKVDDKPDPLEGFTAAHFLKLAEPVKMKLTFKDGGEVDHREFQLDMKEFSTGAYGWTGSGKLKIPLMDDGEVRYLNCNVSCNINIPGSKKANAAKPKSTKAKSKAKKGDDDDDEDEDDDEEDEESEESEPQRRKAKKEVKGKGQGKKAVTKKKKKGESEGEEEEEMEELREGEEYAM